MREIKGLSNPQSFSHTLMQISLNQPVKENAVMKNDDLFNEIIDKIQG